VGAVLYSRDAAASPASQEENGSSSDIKPIYASSIISTITSIKSKQLAVTSTTSKQLTNAF
jgi:hypothetical protein